MKPSECKPGDICDAKGVPVYPGDLIRSYHFRGCGRRHHYLYHVVTQDTAGVLHMTPVEWLAKTELQQYLSGGRCYLASAADDSGVLTDGGEVLTGHGPGDCLCHHDRPRRKVSAVSTE